MGENVLGHGPNNPKLMILTWCPTIEDLKHGKLFSGGSGGFLRSMLDQPNDYYYLSFLPFNDPLPTKKSRKPVELTDAHHAAIKRTWDVIQELKPNVILVLGERALTELTGKNKLMDWRGSVIQSRKGYPKVVPTFHPEQFFRDAVPYFWKFVMQFDIEKAEKEQWTREFNYTPRQLQIARSSADVNTYLYTHKNQPYHVVDIETIHSFPVCVGLASTIHHGISIPLFNRIWDIEITKMPKAELGYIWKFLAEFFDKDIKIVAQNAKFDQEKLRLLGLPFKLYADTMMMGHTLSPELPKRLGFLQTIHSNEPYHKDEGKEFNPKKDKIEDLLLYNAKDCVVQMEVFLDQMKQLEAEGLLDFHFNHVQPLHNIYTAMERRGFRVDSEQRAKLLAKYRGQEQQLENILTQILSPYGIDKFNPRSPKQMALVLYDVLRLPRREGTDEDTLFALLGNHCKKPEQRVFIEALLKLRKVSKTIGTYLEAETDYDGRMRTSIRICGTESGRTSTAVMKPPVRPTEIGLALQTMTKHGDIGADLRSMFIPDEGMVFLEVDLSQAEPRIVAHLSNDEETLELFNSGKDVHSITAGWCLSIDPSQAPKGSSERHIGKCARNGGNYDMKKRRLMMEINTSAKKYGIDLSVSEWKAYIILENFHKRAPKIRGVFHKEIIEIIEETRVLVNPFGRKRTFLGRMDDNLHREGFAQLPQSTVGDQVKRAMRLSLIEDPDLQILLEFHDAMLCQVPKNDYHRYAAMVKKHLETPIDFSLCSMPRGMLVIPAEAEVGDNWIEMKSLKKYADQIANAGLVSSIKGTLKASGI